jgi:hypothetical protein
MALIAVAADKGAPGVTTTAVVLAAVWPRPVLLAECDPAGGDLLYRFPTAGGTRLDPRRGLLSLAVAARRGLAPGQVWEHTQVLRGRLHVLTGVSTAEQGAGLEPLWGPVGIALAQLPRTDVLADCGRLGVDGPPYDLLAQASAIVLVTRRDLGEVVRLRERITALTKALGRRERGVTAVNVVVVADHKGFHTALAEVGEALGHGKGRVNLIGGLAHEPAAARQLHGECGGRLDKSLLARTARDVAGQLASSLPALGIPGARDPREWAQTRPDPRPHPLPVTQRLARSGPARTGRHAGSPAAGARAGADGGPDAPTSVLGPWPAPPGSAGDG